MRLDPLLSLAIFLPLIAWGQTVSFSCGADACVIPFDEEGYPHGTEVCYREHGASEKMKELTWVRGKRQGPARCFENGKLKKEAEYRNDQLNGPYLEVKYDSRGNRVRLLKNGVPHGHEFMVDDSGKVVGMNWCWREGVADSAWLPACAQEDYGKYTSALKIYQKELEAKAEVDAARLAKKMNGPQVTTYPSGKIRSTYTNVNGQMTGVYKVMTEEGKVKVECSYERDRKNGPCVEYDQDGRMDRKEVYKDGKLVSAEKFYDNGKASQKKTREGDGPKFCMTDFYETGTPASSYCQVETGRGWMEYDGAYTYWSSSGVKLVVGQYEKGQEVGVWERFYDDGRVASRSTYEKGLLLKEVQFLDYKLNGNQMVPNKHRIERDFFPDGTVKTEKEYPGHDGPSKEKVI